MQLKAWRENSDPTKSLEISSENAIHSVITVTDTYCWSTTVGQQQIRTPDWCPKTRTFYIHHLRQLHLSKNEGTDSISQPARGKLAVSSDPWAGFMSEVLAEEKYSAAQPPSKRRQFQSAVRPCTKMHTLAEIGLNSASINQSNTHMYIKCEKDGKREFENGGTEI